MPIGGAQSIARVLNLFGPQGLDVRLAGLCDAAEEGEFQRGLDPAQTLREGALCDRAGSKLEDREAIIRITMPFTWR